MEYTALLDLAMKLGYRLAMSGAETYRVEESISRLLDAYGVHAETFAIPNLLIINIETPEGNTLTRMRRIGFHGNDLDAVERYNSLARKLCAETPDPETAIQWLRDTELSKRRFSLPVLLTGNFLGAAGFSVFFGGTLTDSICAGICGVIIGLVNKFMETLKVNPFFTTIAAAFIMAISAYTMGVVGLATNADAVVIGAIMILVPGLLFTNAMRDIIFGDTNSGINRIVQVFLIAAAIAIGTGAAWNLAVSTWGYSAEAVYMPAAWIQCAASFVGCLGFALIFNIHGPGQILCSLGGALTWAVYCIIFHLYPSMLLANLIAAAFAGIYSESMARLRKYPAISYLVVSVFPLLPGAGIYYTANAIVQGDMARFADQGMDTIAVAGALAVGILTISTVVRLHSEIKRHNAHK